MFNPFRDLFAPKYVVGLQVTDHFIGAVQVYNALTGPEITRVFFRELEDQEQSADVLTGIFKSVNLRHEMLVTCVPASLASFRWLSLSFDKVKKLDKIIKYQLEPHIPYPIEQMIVDFLPPGPDGRIMTIGLQKATLADHMKGLSSSDLAPHVVTLDDLALLSLYVRGNRKACEYPVCIYHMGFEKNTLQVISKNRLEFIRVIPGGLNRLEVLEKTIRLYRMDKTHVCPEEILLTGHPGVDQEMADSIADVVRIKTKIWRPYDAFRHRRGEVETALQAKLSVPLGLALSTAASSNDSVNFRKEEFAGSNSLDLKKKFLYMLGTFFLLIVLFTGSVYQNLHISEKRYEELKQNIKTVLTETFPRTRKIVKGRELAQMEQMIGKERAQCEWLDALTGGRTVLDVLRLLTKTISSLSGVTVEDLLIEERGIKLHGLAPSFETVDRLKQRLSNAGIFMTVKLVGAKMDRKEKAVRFDFAMERKQ